MVFELFNKTKTVEIPDDMVRLYEKQVSPFNENVAEYLAVSGDCDENSSETELSESIINGITEESDAYSRRGEIFFQAVKSGVIGNAEDTVLEHIC